MENYFSGDIGYATHLSVGAVVLNDKNEVCVHYFEEIQDLKDFYILMRETVEPHETIEQALARGLMEEFGMKADLVTYLGSQVCDVTWHSKLVAEKTTLYFLCKVISQDSSRRKIGDPEEGSQILWKSIDWLIPEMKEQGKRLKRSDLDESKVLERTKQHLSK